MAEFSTRIYAIWARNSPVGVIFRRGPSKQVQLLKWDLLTDEITPGQWFKGRVYERRCDLSPNGEYLIYFAAKHKEPYYSWTAISRPPFFTALALWPKGDCWGGGGLFDRDKKGITLNHRSDQLKLADDFRLPSNFRVRAHGEHSGGGEDDPIMSHRLNRDGWQRIQEGLRASKPSNPDIWIEFNEPEIWQKIIPEKEVCIHLELHGINEKDGPWYVEELKYMQANHESQMGRCDWADVNSSGVLYYAKGGELFKKSPGEQSQIIADLTHNGFTEVPPSDEALEW